MNIETTTLKNNVNETQKTSSSKANKDSSTNFAEELKTLDMSTLEKEVPEIEETNALKDQSSQIVNNVVQEEFTENNEKIIKSELNFKESNINKISDEALSTTLEKMKNINQEQNKKDNKDLGVLKSEASIDTKNESNILTSEPYLNIQNKSEQFLEDNINIEYSKKDSKTQSKIKENIFEKKVVKTKETNLKEEALVKKDVKVVQNAITTDEKAFNNETNVLNEKVVDNAIERLNTIVKEFNQSDDKKQDLVQKEDKLADKQDMINNDFNIQENKEVLPQMSLNMGFSGDGQPFSSFMNDSQQNDSKNQKEVLISSAQDLAEEAAILSTMAENIAIANRNQVVLKDKPSVDNKKEVVINRQASNENKVLLEQPVKEVVQLENKEQVVIRNDGIKKIDTQTGITQEVIVKFDNVIMNEADVEVFTQIVQQGDVDIKNLAPLAAEKSISVSKMLAEMLAKSMENNQPLRIDFDNDISVIIRINRDGKISADFLPSSQIAEAYLKENLPLLKQKFDENNVKYDELNQRERREQKDNNRKKGRNNE